MRKKLKKGSADPEMKNRILIPASRIPKNLRLRLKDVHESVRDVTFYRFNTKTQKVECLLSLTPGGWHLGWDSCGTCMRYFTKCDCKTIAPTAGVLHILDRKDAWERISRSAAYVQWEKMERPKKSLPPLPASKPLPLAPLKKATNTPLQMPKRLPPLPKKLPPKKLPPKKLPPLSDPPRRNNRFASIDLGMENTLRRITNKHKANNPKRLP